MKNHLIACVQLNTGNNLELNIDNYEKLVTEAAKNGACLIVSPENTFFMDAASESYTGMRFAMESHPGVLRACELARSTGSELVLGSVAIQGKGDKMCNRSIFINAEGAITAYYDKIHLFDAAFSCGESYMESKRFEAGRVPVIAESAIGKIGMTICYDIRFPLLFRSLRKSGADMFTTPAAFTVPTGKAHWHVMQRARAIENLSYVFAAAQCGEHPGGRRTYGHSMIVNPWGEVLAEAGDEPTVIYASFDAREIEKAREALPTHVHEFIFEG